MEARMFECNLEKGFYSCSQCGAGMYVNGKPTKWIVSLSCCRGGMLVRDPDDADNKTIDENTKDD